MDVFTKNDVKLIICDLSDVLIKGLEGVEKSISKVLGVSESTVKDFIFSYEFMPFWLGQVSEKDFFNEMILRSGWRISFYEMKYLIRKNFYEINGTRQVYTYLSKEYNLALLSVNSREWVEYMEKKYNYSYLFNAGTFYSYDIGYTKRQPECFEFILNKFQICPYQVLLIDDSQRFVDVAQQIGIKAIKFENANLLIEELKKKGIWGV